MTRSLPAPTNPMAVSVERQAVSQVVRWERRLHELRAHLAREGAYPTQKTDLGSWVKAQREAYKRQALPPERTNQLEALPGWAWSVREDRWHMRYAELSAHLESEKSYPAWSSVLGRWVKEQRMRRRAEQLEAARTTLLEELPGWTWNDLDGRWERRFEELGEYLGREGRYPTDGTRLGGWLRHQKDAIKRGSVSADRRARLEALPGWAENNLASRWENRFEELCAYLAARHGYPVKSTRLGIWISQQRLRYRDGSLNADRRARLEGLPGWAWNGLDGRWERQFEELSAHLAREGRYPTQGRGLGSWISRQRVGFTRGSLSRDRRERLEGLAGWKWAGPFQRGNL